MDFLFRPVIINPAKHEGLIPEVLAHLQLSPFVYAKPFKVGTTIPTVHKKRIFT